MNTILSHTPSPPDRVSVLRRAVPPLENGATLDAAEFMRRYDASPEIKKAELIEGVVYIMASPVRFKMHAEPDGTMHAILGNYALATRGMEFGANATVKLDDATICQPDALLRIKPAYGGKSDIDEEGYVLGPPELIVEIAASSVSMDTHRKLRAFQNHGVQEYIVWCTEDEGLFWWSLKDSQYQLLPMGDDGILRSTVFPGLWIDPNALIALDGTRIKAVMQAGLDSAEHAAFSNAK